MCRNGTRRKRVGSLEGAMKTLTLHHVGSDS